jgi:hypothetical protein
MKKIIFGALASVAVLAAPVAAGAAELVVNGDFETGTFAGWTQGGNTGATGVAAPDSNFIVPIGQAPLGNYSAYLGPVGSVGSLSQTLNTVAGDVYSVSFELANLGSPPDSFSATIGGDTILAEDSVGPSEITIPNVGSYYIFSAYNYTFTATGSSTPLDFTFRQDPSYFVLDNVSVTGTSGVISAVPEPSTWALMLVGFGMIGFAARQGRAGRRMNVVTA